jgi:hypothetical protein
MARNSFPRRKKPMSTAVAKPKNDAAVDILVERLMEISKKALANVPPSELEARLNKLEDYLSSLGESDAKRA